MDGWAPSACGAQWDSGLEGLPFKTARSHPCKPPGGRHHAGEKTSPPPLPPPHKERLTHCGVSRPLFIKLQTVVKLWSRFRVRFSSPGWKISFFLRSRVFFLSTGRFTIRHQCIAEFYRNWVCFSLFLSCVYISQTSLPSEWNQALYSLKSRLLHHVGYYLCLNGFEDCTQCTARNSHSLFSFTEFLLSWGDVKIMPKQSKSYHFTIK